MVNSAKFIGIMQIGTSFHFPINNYTVYHLDVLHFRCGYIIAFTRLIYLYFSGLLCMIAPKHTLIIAIPLKYHRSLLHVNIFILAIVNLDR